MHKSQLNNNIILLILDGWGLYEKTRGNAIAMAKTPFYDHLLKTQPNAIMHTSGQAVGLPHGQIGTSEVNHLTIGAGRILHQSLVRVNQAIENKSFFRNKSFLKTITHVKKKKSTLHLVGLYSNGGVHSHAQHLKALVRMAKQNNITKLKLHLFTDGRDVLPRSARYDFLHLRTWLKEIGLGSIVSVSGRYYGMDRDENWGRTNKAFYTMTEMTSPSFPSLEKLFDSMYGQQITDEFIPPSLLTTQKSSYHIHDGDGIIFFNFRSDRMRQLVHLFLQKPFAHLAISTMTDYKADLHVTVAFPKISVAHHLVHVLDEKDIDHHHVSETEKYAHVTYFFNGRRETPYPHELRTHVKSYSDVATHDLKPQMRAPEITQAITEIIKHNKKGFIVANFANADIVGHTANIPATIKACEIIDGALKEIIPLALKNNWTIFTTADHGNAEMLIDPESKGPHTAHTLNPVPLILSSEKSYRLKKHEASLADIAPTILDLMGIDKPKEMTGESLV